MFFFNLTYIIEAFLGKSSRSIKQFHGIRNYAHSHLHPSAKVAEIQSRSAWLRALIALRCTDNTRRRPTTPRAESRTPLLHRIAASMQTLLTPRRAHLCIANLNAPPVPGDSHTSAPHKP